MRILCTISFNAKYWNDLKSAYKSNEWFTLHYWLHKFAPQSNSARRNSQSKCASNYSSEKRNIKEEIVFVSTRQDSVSVNPLAKK